MKKFRKILFILTFSVISALFAFNVNAAPIEGLEQILTQPNGTEITVYIYGDEIYNYMTDAEGNVIVKNPESGYYVYATLNGGNIISTNRTYGIVNAGSASGGGGGGFLPLKADDMPASEYDTAYKKSRFYKDANTPEVQSLDYSEKDFNGMDINNIVVFIKFKDINYSRADISFYDNLFNTSSTSVKKYYEETSYGQLSITSSFYPKTTSSAILTYTDSNDASYYNSLNYNQDWTKQQEREQTMFKNALEYVKNQIPKDLDLDKNNDGYVDMITFVVPGLLMPGSNQVCWPHQWSFASNYVTTINGLQTNLYNVQVEGALRGLTASDGTYSFQKESAIIAHETHHILGFPDMYYYNFSWPTNDDSLQEWDIMCASNGAHTTAYMKNTYGGWLDIPEIKEDGTYMLNSLQDGGTCAYKLRSPNSANEYFIIEYRKKVGNFESKIPNTGLVIYRVLADKYMRGNQYAITSDGKNDELRFIQQKTSGTYIPTLSSGVTSGIYLSSISASGGETANFNITFTNNKYMKYFNDKNLADAVASAIGKSEAYITDSDLQGLTSLSIYGGNDKQNYDLTGLEQLTGLKTLSLRNCKIDNITALSNLTDLTSLALTDNHITDISPLSNLSGLKKIYLRGNYIDDYSPVSSYYDNVTGKDFSLSDKNDAVFYITDFADGKVDTIYLRLSNTSGNYLYYIMEKYDAATDKLLSRKKSSTSSNSKVVTVPESFIDDENTYIKLKVYENDTYRHLMSETIIDHSILDLSTLN